MDRLLLGPEVLALALQMLEGGDEDREGDLTLAQFSPQYAAQLKAPPPPPEPKRQRELMELRAAPTDPLHSCTHLRKVYPNRLDARMCQGTCSSAVPAATGRICQWPAGAACECPYFESRLKETARP